MNDQYTEFDEAAYVAYIEKLVDSITELQGYSPLLEMGSFNPPRSMPLRKAYWESKAELLRLKLVKLRAKKPAVMTWEFFKTGAKFEAPKLLSKLPVKTAPDAPMPRKRAKKKNAVEPATKVRKPRQGRGGKAALKRYLANNLLGE